MPGRVLLRTVVTAIAEETAPRCCALTAAGRAPAGDRARRPGQGRAGQGAVGSRAEQPQRQPVFLPLKPQRLFGAANAAAASLGKRA